MTRYALGIDPGGAHVGTVLATLTYDEAGGTLAAVDALTIDRTDKSERRSWHAGPPTFARRAIAEIFAMLDRHGVADDDLGLVAVETILPPKPTLLVGAARSKKGLVSGRIVASTIDAGIVAGALIGVFDTAWLVAPAGADLRKTYPPELRGRRPPSWSPTGSARQHQRAAWAVMSDALEQRSAMRTKTAAKLVERSGKRSIPNLLDAARKVAPDAEAGELIDLSARAAALLDPSADAGSLRARLAIRLAALDAA